MKLLADNFTVDRIWAQDNSAHTIVCPIKWPPRSPGNSKSNSNLEAGTLELIFSRPDLKLVGSKTSKDGSRLPLSYEFVNLGQTGVWLVWPFSGVPE